MTQRIENSFDFNLYLNFKKCICCPYAKHLPGMIQAKHGKLHLLRVRIIGYYCYFKAGRASLRGNQWTQVCVFIAQVISIDLNTSEYHQPTGSQKGCLTFQSSTPGILDTTGLCIIHQFTVLKPELHISGLSKSTHRTSGGIRTQSQSGFLHHSLNHLPEAQGNRS